MNISGPITEFNAFNKNSNTSDNIKILNSTLRIASYAAMFFAAAATVLTTLALGIACPAAGAAALLAGLAITLLLYDTHQTSKAADESLLGDGSGGKVSRLGKKITDFTSGKGKSGLIWAEALTQNTFAFKHIASLASAA